MRANSFLAGCYVALAIWCAALVICGAPPSYLLLIGVFFGGYWIAYKLLCTPEYVQRQKDHQNSLKMIQATTSAEGLSGEDPFDGMDPEDASMAGYTKQAEEGADG